MKRTCCSVHPLDGRVSIPDKCKFGPNLTRERWAASYSQWARSASTSRGTCSRALI
jgi:hypothetical protein